MFRIALNCFAALMIIGAGMGTCGNEDRPVVVSSDEGEPSTGTITAGVVGRVTTPERYPVAGAFVQAVSPSGSGPPIPDIAILSDGEGRYMWPLLPGVYALSVSADGYKPATRPVTVEAGKVATLDVVLERIP